MRVAIFGTGGVGGYVGAQLAAVGVDVVFIARGAHLEAIRTKGLHLDSVLGDVLVSPAQASDSPADVGRVEVVLLGVKTWQVPEAAAAIRPLLGPETFVVPLQKGWKRPRCWPPVSGQSTWGAGYVRRSALSPALGIFATWGARH